MADIKQCDIKAPHERHNWQSSELYEGFVPQTIPLYHVCNGKRWTNTGVYNRLKELITEVLKAENPNYWQGGLNPATRITDAIWQDMVGFVQPEDMPLRYILKGDDLNDPQTWNISPGSMVQIPPDPMTRIAEAVEKIESYMRPLPAESYSPEDL